MKQQNKLDLNQLEIIPMEIEHLGRVLEIENLSFPAPWSLRSYKGELTRNNFAHYFVAVFNGEVIGYLGLWIVVDESHITTIAVDPAFRGNRIAQHLIEFGEEYSKIWGAEKMILEVRITNLAAQKVYKRMGFEQIGIRKNYYAETMEDAIVMLKHYDDLNDIREKVDSSN